MLHDDKAAKVVEVITDSAKTGKIGDGKILRHAGRREYSHPHPGKSEDAI